MTIEGIVTYDFVLGKYERHLAGVGSVFLFLKTTSGYILFVFIPFMLLIFIEVFNCLKLFQRYKREQMEEIAAEKEQMEAEHEETKRMLEELQRQIAQKDAAGGE